MERPIKFVDDTEACLWQDLVTATVSNDHTTKEEAVWLADYIVKEFRRRNK